MPVNNFIYCKVKVKSEMLASFKAFAATLMIPYYIDSTFVLNKERLIISGNCTVFFSCFYRQSCHNRIRFGIIVFLVPYLRHPDYGMQSVILKAKHGYFPDELGRGVTLWKCKLWVLNSINVICKFRFVSLPVQKNHRDSQDTQTLLFHKSFLFKK